MSLIVLISSSSLSYSYWRGDWDMAANHLRYRSPCKVPFGDEQSSISQYVHANFSIPVFSPRFMVESAKKHFQVSNEQGATRTLTLTLSDYLCWNKFLSNKRISDESNCGPTGDVWVVCIIAHNRPTHSLVPLGLGQVKSDETERYPTPTDKTTSRAGRQLPPELAQQSMPESTPPPVPSNKNLNIVW